MKSLVDAELTIAAIFEMAPHLEAIRGIEEKERVPNVTILRLDNTENLKNSVNNTVESSSFSQKSPRNNHGSFCGKNSFRKSSCGKKIKAEDLGIDAEEAEGVAFTKEAEKEPQLQEGLQDCKTLTILREFSGNRRRSGILMWYLPEMPTKWSLVVGVQTKLRVWNFTRFSKKIRFLN